MSTKPQLLCIHHKIEECALQMPEAIALIFQQERLTYRELNEKANQLAHYLQSLGVKPDVAVGVCLDRTPDTIIALLAILKAGGAYVPLDPIYPAKRLALMVEDSQLSILLTRKDLADIVPQGAATVINLDAEREQIARESTTNPASSVQPDNLAYIIYTSGSTGRPKGVAMPHRPLANLLAWQLQQSLSTLGARTLQFTPISFDVSFQEIFGTLAAGGTLVLIGDRLRRDPAELLQFMQKNAIQRLFLPFVALRQLAEVGNAKQILLPDLREVITAGEQLRITTAIREWFSQLPECRLFNHYGPSETHVVTAFALPDSPRDWSLLPPIGTPIDNVCIYLLNSRYEPVPTGVPGELYLGGVGLARGYLHRPDITAERFIANPFTDESSDRLYKTGDLARYLPDGNLEFLGRADRQVKLRGFRIELGEIEAILEEHPKVCEAIVMAREGTSGSKRLAAYVSLQNPEAKVSLSPKQLYRFLRDRLPEYMIPAAFIVLPKFPLIPSGKIDYRALPDPQWQSLGDQPHIPPQTPLEVQLAGIWSQVLDIEEVGIQDRFSDLGGNSLLAVELIARIEGTFALQIPLDRFLECPTIAGLAEEIVALLSGKASVAAGGNLEAKGELDASIYPENLLNEPIPNIFLTGATGFLGAFLLRELLDRTRADIHCLVRATKPAEARVKLKGALQQYHLWNEDFSDRIIAIPGDLSKPHFGIAPKPFFRLSEKIDIIYHCGAWVNVLYPYAALESANVKGTEEVLRLAGQTKVKPVHFISTIDVLAASPLNNITTIGDSTEIGPGEALDSGYAQSKYVAEKLMQSAQKRGIPVSIYRPSNIMGVAQTGIGDARSFIATAIKGCIQMGMAPDIDAALNLVPVDYASRAIVHLSQTCEPCGGAFYIVNPQTVAWRDFVGALVACGYPLQLTDYETWHDRLLELARNKKDNALIPFSSHLVKYKFIQKLLGTFRFDCPELFAALADRSLLCPKVDRDLLTTYLAYFEQNGFIPSPAVQNKLEKILISL
ncbi:MAG: amino acid adenylation domain-containing protein [Cyanobacteria bacterium SBLK]|nr:amino acid adenylation domain-containing protein [Cyanobacteria bacterium SBLK]